MGVLGHGGGSGKESKSGGGDEHVDAGEMGGLGDFERAVRDLWV